MAIEIWKRFQQIRYIKCFRNNLSTLALNDSRKNFVFFLTLIIEKRPLFKSRCCCHPTLHDWNVCRILWLVSYPFAHDAIVEGQANELEGSFLDEVGVQDSNLGRLPRYIVSHRLPETLYAPLRKHKEKEGKTEKCTLVENPGLFFPSIRSKSCT